MKYPLLFHFGKRPQNSKHKLRAETIDFIKSESRRGHFPSKREIQNKFHCSLTGNENLINTLYAEAGLKYKLSPNQQEKINKATILLDIISENLSKFNLIFIKSRKITERGIDIIASDTQGIVGIELKAYNVGESVKLKDLNQVKKAIKKEKLTRAIIITTTDKTSVKIKSEDKIRLVTYSELVNILPIKHLPEIESIRNSSVNIWTNEKDLKRQRILDFVSAKNKEGVKPSYNLILKELNLDLYTYFKNLFEIYKILKILPPTRNMRGLRSKYPDKEVIEMWKTQFKEYIQEEIQLGKYPSGAEIGKRFGISHIWNIAKVSELYQELKIPHYRERKARQ